MTIRIILESSIVKADTVQSIGSGEQIVRPAFELVRFILGPHTSFANSQSYLR